MCSPRSTSTRRRKRCTGTPSGPASRRRAYLLLTGATIVAAVAIPVVLVLRPAPLTGDTEADAACHVLARATLSDGQMSGAKLGTLSDGERREVVGEVMQHAERSKIEEIRRAGTALGAATSPAAVPPMDDTADFRMPVEQFQNACGRHGWTPQHAGLAGKT